jgi:hypothetical protein
MSTFLNQMKRPGELRRLIDGSGLRGIEVVVSTKAE